MLHVKLVSSSLTQAHPASARGSRHVDGARIRSLVGIRGRADRVLGVVLPCHHLLTESHRRHHDGHGTSCDSRASLHASTEAPRPRAHARGRGTLGRAGLPALAAPLCRRNGRQFFENPTIHPLYFISCSKRGQGAWGPLARAVVTLVARYLITVLFCSAIGPPWISGWEV